MTPASPVDGLLIPVRSVRSLPGAFAWPDSPILAGSRLVDRLPLQRLAAHLPGRPKQVFNAAGPAHLRMERIPLQAEAYRLHITPDAIQVQAGDDAGAAYALATVRDLLRIHGATLPCCRIDDCPDLSRRGVYLDCSRGKVPRLDTLRDLIEKLADWKINELQLYIENVFQFHRHPDIGRGFSPFSPRDLLELQAHAKQRHVRLVPSLSSFGHFERILGLPGYRSLGEKAGHYGIPGGTTLCPGDPRSLRLVSDLYAEFLPLFDAIDFNACCDETWALGSGRSRKRAAKRGSETLYLEFVLKLHRLCLKHNKRMNIWADILLNHPALAEQIPADVVLLNWEYEPEGPRIPRTRELVGAGRSFLVCPGTHGWKSHGTRLQRSVANVSRFARVGRRLGAEGLLNTDWGDLGHRNPLGVSLHSFAHGAAHAWHGRGVDDDTFTQRFCDQHWGRQSKQAARLTTELGRNEDRAGAMLYAALGTSLDAQRDPFRGIPRISPVWQFTGHRQDIIEQADVAGCHRIVETLEGVTGPEDLVLAARMDRLAARRILAGKAIRAGAPPSSRVLRVLRSDTEHLADDFATNWAAHYRPSRLRDNLRLFANAAEEYS